AATARRAAEHAAADRVLADHVVVARSGDGVPASVAESLVKVPGAGATGVVSTNVYLLGEGVSRGGSGWRAAGIDPDGGPAALDVDVRSGSLSALRGNAVAVSETVARAGDLTVGSVVQAQLADASKVRLRVVAVYGNANGLGDVILPHALALSHAVAALDTAVFMTGGDTHAGAEALADLT